MSGSTIISTEDFVFDNQMLSQIIYLGYEIAEITCPTRYFEEASSINFSRSVTYGLVCSRSALSIGFVMGNHEKRHV